MKKYYYPPSVENKSGFSLSIGHSVFVDFNLYTVAFTYSLIAAIMPIVVLVGLFLLMKHFNLAAYFKISYRPMLWLSGPLIIYFYPFLLGNPLIRKALSNHRRFEKPSDKEFITQILFDPRLYPSIPKWLTDMDDIGWVSIEDDCLRFKGDRVDMTLPLNDIEIMSIDESWIGKTYDRFAASARIQLTLGLPHYPTQITLGCREGNTRSRAHGRSRQFVKTLFSEYNDFLERNKDRIREEVG